MKNFIVLLLIASSCSVFAYGTAQTRQNYDGSLTTRYSDGSTATSREMADGSMNTRFSDGSTAMTRRNYDGSTTTTFN